MKLLLNTHRGLSLRLGLKAGYLRVRTAGGESNRCWLKVRHINGLTYLLTDKLYKSLRVAGMICTTLVNTHTHTHIHRAFDQLFY